MSLSSLEKFIRNYVKNKKLTETDEGYAAWLRKNGISGEADFSENVARVRSDYAKSVLPSGKNSELLYGSGLKKSGYADYLEDSALKNQTKGFEESVRGYLQEKGRMKNAFEEDKAAEEDAKRKAEEKAAEEEAKRLEKEAKEESERLAKEEKAKKALYNSAKKDLEKAGTINYDEAYNYAMEMGLDKESAERLASTTTKIARDNAIYRVTKAIVDKRLTMNQTRLYAISLGLSEEDAEKLAEIAFKTNESVGDITAFEDYLDFLKDKSNQNKN